MTDYVRTPTPGYPWFFYDPNGDGMLFFASQETRDAYASTALRDWCSDGMWPDETEMRHIIAGTVELVATQVDRQERPPANELDEDGYDKDGICWEEGFNYLCDYEMRPLSNVPSPKEAMRDLHLPERQPAEPEKTGS